MRHTYARINRDPGSDVVTLRTAISTLATHLEVGVSANEGAARATLGRLLSCSVANAAAAKQGDREKGAAMFSSKLKVHTEVPSSTKSVPSRPNFHHR